MNRSLLYLYLLMMMIMVACKKKSPDTPIEEPQNITGTYENVKVIDTNNIRLTSSPAMQADGNYEYEITGKAPVLRVGDIIIGMETTEGYAGKITSVGQNKNILSVKTTPADLAEIFRDTTVSFSFRSDTSARINKQGNNQEDQSKITLEDIFLYGDKDAPFQVKLNKSYVSFDPDWVFDMTFGNYRLKTFKFGLDKETKLTGHFELQALLKGNGVNLKDSKTLKTFHATRTFFVPGTLIPVRVTAITELIFRYSADIKLQTSIKETFNFDHSITATFNYNQQDGWTQFYKRIAVFTPDFVFETPAANYGIKGEFAVRVNFKIYNLNGPYLEPAIVTYADAKIALLDISNNDLEAGVNLRLKSALQEGTLSRFLGKLAWEVNSDTLKYQWPFKLEIVDGNNQEGTAGNTLARPVKVKVSDSFGRTVKGAFVHFKISLGNGSVGEKTVISDENGFASTSWVLGNNPKAQQVEAYVQKSNNKHIENSPVTFTATIKTSTPVECSTIPIESGVNVPGRFLFAAASGGAALFAGPGIYFPPTFPCPGGKDIKVTYYVGNDDKGPRSVVVATMKCKCEP
jgi:hypothetical protein